VTRKLGTAATIVVPRKARLDEPGKGNRFERPTWVGWKMGRIHTWAMGSFTPYRAYLFVNLHSATAPSSSYDEARRANVEDMNGGADDAKQLVKDAQWDIMSGRYTVNTLNEPVWRLSYRDTTRRVSAVWQVYQKDWTLDDARAALVKMVESVKRTAMEPDYAEIADRPRRQAEENERKYTAALAWLADRGYGPLEPGKAITKDGITVELMHDPERRLAFYKTVAARPPASSLPPFVSTGTRSWNGSEWEDTMDNNDYYPSPATRAYLARTLSKESTHTFIVRTIRLDELDEVDFHIADWFAYAATVK
jgi:hypothetical protein